jgi:hypothetical protein
MKYLSKSKKSLTFISLILFLISLYACGGQQAQQEQSVEIAKLSKKYTKLVIYPFSATAEIEKDYPDATTEMMSSMMTALQMKGAFQSVQVAKKNQKIDRNTLLLKGDITDLRVVSSAARFFGGVFAGSSGVDVKLTLIDGGTKKVVRDEPMNSSNNAWAASYSAGSTDKSLISDMGKIIAGYVMAIMPS